MIAKFCNIKFPQAQINKFVIQAWGDKVYIIHDNASQFHFNFLHFGLKDIRISVNAPNMNSISERFVGSVRREALNKNQIHHRHSARIKIIRNTIVRLK